MRYLLLITLFFGLLQAVPARPAHEFHATITEVKYNPQTKHFETGIRFFTDDLAAVLSKEQDSKVKIDKTGQADPLIASYVLKRFQLQGPRNAVLQCNFLGTEIDEDLLWVYLELPLGNYPLNGLSVQNTILMDHFEDQVNTVNVFIDDKVGTFVLRKGEESKAISFN